MLSSIVVIYSWCMIKIVSFLFLLRKSKIKFIPLCQSKSKLFSFSQLYPPAVFNFSFMSVLPVCLFIFLNHISTSANAFRHNSQRWAKLHLILPALMSFISAERERPQVNKSIMLSGVVWSGSSPARYEAWPRRCKLQWPQLISDWSQTAAQFSQPGFSSTAYTHCPHTVNKPELPFRLSWDQLPFTVSTFSHIRVSQSGFQLRMKG